MSNPTSRHPPFLTPSSRGAGPPSSVNQNPAALNISSSTGSNPRQYNDILFQSPATPIGASMPQSPPLRQSSSFDPYSDVTPAPTPSSPPNSLARNTSAVAGPRQPRYSTGYSYQSSAQTAPVTPPRITPQASVASSTTPFLPNRASDAGFDSQPRQNWRQSRPPALPLGSSTAYNAPSSAPYSAGGQGARYGNTPTSPTQSLGSSSPRQSRHSGSYYPLPLQLHQRLNDYPSAQEEPLYQEIPIPVSNLDDGYGDHQELKTSHAVFPRASRRRENPFGQNFEPPKWWFVLIHTILCMIAYPVILLFILLARDRSLFWTRFIVSLGCGLIGVMLGMSLLRTAKAWLEAATWATIIHQSRVAGAPGIRLKDLAATSGDPYSPYSGLKLLWDRQMYPGAMRKNRGYDGRPWALFILFFLLLVGVSSALPFVFGRLVDIDARISSQRERYYESTIIGDISQADIDRANGLKGAFEDFTLTWTMASFSSHGGLPPVVSLEFENETIYFSETILSQLTPNGSGFGTFDTSTTDASVDVQDQETTGRSIDVDGTSSMDPGVLLRYPRWGLRVRCAKLADPTNMIKRSVPGNFTYMFVPRDLLHGLFDEFELPFPGLFTKELAVADVLDGATDLPEGYDLSPMATYGRWYDNGVTHNFMSIPMSMGEEGTGWVSVEPVMIRVNTSYTPQGRFLTLSDLSVPDVTGAPSHIGYDGAVCLEVFEPWILETYNTTIGLPSTLRIVNKGNRIIDHNSDDVHERMTGSRVNDPDAKRNLTSVNLAPVYIAARTNSINQIIKDNGRDAFYVPNPTMISYTGGSGPQGYTELNPVSFAQSRGLADANNMLPYFAGSGKTVARCYPDDVLSSASILKIQMIIALSVILVLGIIGNLFVPKLPLSVPSRGFELYSWMAAFQADELVGAKLATGFSKNLELKDIQNEMADLRFRYVN